ncbi:MAG TPA: hypothetical protein VIM70_16750 [Clostridium sp.]|uniref:hypothetical protein n=1 Tax=Clostridium sp. TaxID=1506 RepID=UPI002F929B22
MKLGFIIPYYSGEKRVALLPAHVNNFENDIVIELSIPQTITNQSSAKWHYMVTKKLKKSSLNLLISNELIYVISDLTIS